MKNWGRGRYLLYLPLADRWRDALIAARHTQNQPTKKTTAVEAVVAGPIGIRARNIKYGW